MFELSPYPIAGPWVRYRVADGDARYPEPEIPLPGSWLGVVPEHILRAISPASTAESARDQLADSLQFTSHRGGSFAAVHLGVLLHPWTALSTSPRHTHAAGALVVRVGAVVAVQQTWEPPPEKLRLPFHGVAEEMKAVQQARDWDKLSLLCPDLPLGAARLVMLGQWTLGDQRLVVPNPAFRKNIA